MVLVESGSRTSLARKRYMLGPTHDSRAVASMGYGATDMCKEAYLHGMAPTAVGDRRELLPEGKVLEYDVGARSEPGPEGAEQQEKHDRMRCRRQRWNINDLQPNGFGERQVVARELNMTPQDLRDHAVRSLEHLRRDRDTDIPGRLQVHDQLVAVDFLNG